LECGGLAAAFDPAAIKAAHPPKQFDPPREPLKINKERLKSLASAES
jgi:hypothetical protein